MKAILCADRNWGIGFHGHQLVSIPSDTRFFREKTLGKVVVMGRRTLESLSGGQPLTDRTNIVLSRNPSFEVRNASVVHSRSELFHLLKTFDSDEIYVIGGGEIYELLLPYCDEVFVTRVDMNYEADTYFPNLDYMPEWEKTEESEEQTCFDIAFTFCTYRKKYHTILPED